jgi:hypothetical protein
MCTSQGTIKLTMIHEWFVYTQTDGNVLLGHYFPLKKWDTRCNPSQAITSDECNAICPLKSKQTFHLIKQGTQVQNTTENQLITHE